MSCLLFVNKHNEKEDLGTDFYDENLKLAKLYLTKIIMVISFQVVLTHGMVWKKKK